jgi:diadenosine tetraphosphate (Ap4A) HIT family hydrolase
MTAQRSTKEEFLYKKYRKDNRYDTCPFCSIRKIDDQFVEDLNSFRVIKNRFPYSMWDGQKVLDHLMIIPKKHTDNLDDINAAEALEFLKLISKYEKLHYSFYGRTPSSETKSVSHQHTHLLKLDNKQHRLIIMIRKPYYLRIKM